MVEAKVRDECPLFSAVTDWIRPESILQDSSPSSGPPTFRRQIGPKLWRSGSRTLSMVLVPATLVSAKRLALIVTDDPSKTHQWTTDGKILLGIQNTPKACSEPVLYLLTLQHSLLRYKFL